MCIQQTICNSITYAILTHSRKWATSYWIPTAESEWALYKNSLIYHKSLCLCVTFLIHAYLIFLPQMVQEMIH